MPPALRSTARPARPGLAIALAAVVALGACAHERPMPSDARGRLYARALDEIGDFYIKPVSSRAVAVAGAAGLSRLDRKLAVAERPAPGGRVDVVLSYGGRELADDPMPAADDSHDWGGLVGAFVADAKTASPLVARLSDDTIDAAVLTGMTGALDRFSHYSTPRAAADQTAARDGFGGIGITIAPSGRQFRIRAVMPHGPADKAGLKPGERIVAIDGVTTAGRSQSKVIHRLRGPVSSFVDLTVLDPPPPGRERRVRIERKLITVPTVALSQDDGIAIFRVVGFNQDTTEELVGKLRRVKRELGARLRGVVLDLRDNPGGLLDQAVSLANVFLPRGPIAATVGRHPASRQFFKASGRGIALDVPMVVLINGRSASASEIVASALQDAGRAVIVGSASYGKGTVQTVLHLPNKGELTVTWALLITPGGYFLNHHGVVPTLCTSDLGDGAQALQIGLERARAAGRLPAARSRASLDDADWARLRRSCPARRGDRPIDLKLAERLLGNPVLYRQALRAVAPSERLAAARRAPEAAAPRLTPAGASLLSTESPH